MMGATAQAKERQARMRRSDNSKHRPRRALNPYVKPMNLRENERYGMSPREVDCEVLLFSHGL